MATTLHSVQKKNFSKPDETRSFTHGKLDIVQVGETAIGKATFQPGWRWSQDVKPIAQTDSCQAEHLGYVISGTMTVAMDDGTRLTFGPGDVMAIPPGHDAWIEGNDVMEVVDFVGFSDYAKPK
ncbi:MAG TPA: cupin domain-containing protein [Candidatus Limnocylindria bacterium]|nr:cupin domain-containing protein [Candidatus Limnocylindria bacterium]